MVLASFWHIIGINLNTPVITVTDNSKYPQSSSMWYNVYCNTYMVQDLAHWQDRP